MREGRDPRWGLYVHVPYCRLHCPYCAFDVQTGDAPRREAAFVDAVLAEVAQRRAAFVGAPLTVYIGGGTPSRLATSELTRLIRGLVTSPAREVTCEANPEDVDDSWVRAVADAGVDRVSLGVQSMVPATARRIGRATSSRHAAAAAAALRGGAVRSWSADLMFGLPGQTQQAFLADLEALLALQPPHVSVYGLTLEPGTPFERARGALRLPDEEAWADMFDLLVARLGEAGLERYEVSNFALPGHESQHNQGYWSDRPYLGVGPSAHSDLPDDTRTVDVTGADAWLDAKDRVADRELVVGADRARDTLISGLRGVDGLSREHLVARTGHDVAADVVSRLVAAGALLASPGRLQLGPRGWALADHVTATLADSLRPQAQE